MLFLEEFPTNMAYYALKQPKIPLKQPFIGTYTPRIQINAVLVFIISRYWSKSIIRRALPSAFQSSFNHFARPLDRKERISPGSQLKTNRICQFGLFYSKIYYKMGVLQIKRGVFWMLLDGMCDVNALFGRFSGPKGLTWTNI